MNQSKSKYKNKKIVVDSVKFDSLVEYEFYQYLCTIADKKDIILHPKFVLQDKFVKNDIKYREINYIADFMLGSKIWDVKGVITDVFKIKKKLFDAKYNDLDIILINRCPRKYQHITKSEWIDLNVLKKLKKVKI